MEAETGWGRTIWFSEIGKAVAEGWAEGRRLGQTKSRAEGKAEGRAEGKAEGIARALWMVLQARQLVPTKKQRARIEACRDHRQLERWLRKALLVDDVAEIFGR